MDNTIPRQPHQEDVLYIYDRVCRKNSKKRQIHHAYRTSEPQREQTSGGRPFGIEFAEQQRKRARQSPYGQRNSRANPHHPNGTQGGEAVHSPPFKLIIERIINLFDTIEERGKRDEAIAKQRAIAWKKFSEYRHILLTTLLLLVITVVFALLVYKLFFVVEDVQVSGTAVYTEAEILAAAGFASGDNLYSFSSTDAEEQITFLCPYIMNASVDRTIPKSVSIAVQDDTAVYYANIWGDTVKLSAGLRVLEVVRDSGGLEGLTELVLPPVQYSVAGRVLEFEDTRHERFIREVLSEVNASALVENGMVDAVDLSDEYDITIESGGRYLLRLGDETDCDLKLRMAYKTMTDEKFDTLLPARIDLSEVGRAIVKPDASLTLDE